MSDKNKIAEQIREIQKAHLQARVQELRNEIPKYENLYFGHTYYGIWEPKAILMQLNIKTILHNDACYCSNEEQLNLFLVYKSLTVEQAFFGCEVLYTPHQIDNAVFRGPDWYFVEGFPEDRDGPGYWKLVTLGEKKSEFQKYCAEYEGLVDFDQYGK